MIIRRFAGTALLSALVLSASISPAAAAKPPERPNGAPAITIPPGSWVALGGGGTNPFFGALNSHVYAVTTYGDTVYVGGNFSDAGGDPAADYIARWDGAGWDALGTAAPFASGYVNTILVDGTNVYIGGSFSNAGGGSTG